MRFYDQVALHPARIPLPRIWCPNRFPATMGNDDSTPFRGDSFTPSGERDFWA
jgi:hypothetical protein